jgi:tetratricopeptide (TPR) repeat protein
VNWFERGLAMFRIDNDRPGAARAFAKAIRANPRYERAWVNRGLVYEQLDNVQQAIEDYSMSVSLDPDDGKAYYFRGLAFRRLGMDENALRDLNTAAALGYTAADRALESMNHPLRGSSRR